MYDKSAFTQFANRVASAAGQPLAFVLALGIIIAWGLSGPIFGFSDTWQLVINTGTTIITFLMVFVIQNTQNRDGKALQLKLDELIRATQGAHNALLDLEELDEKHLNRIREIYVALAAKARGELEQGLRDTDGPEVALAESASRKSR
ncbi:MAG: low affinity iron permease family protein [Dongiaceae bacterium]